MEYLDKEDRKHQKSDYYMAQIAAEIRRGIEAQKEHPRPVKVEDFLVKYEDEVESKKPKSKEVSKTEKIASSKKAWFTVTGINKKGKRNG